MTTTQSFKIYEILQRHFNNNEYGKTVVQEIEQIVEAKVDSKSNVLTIKADLALLKEEKKTSLCLRKIFINFRSI